MKLTRNQADLVLRHYTHEYAANVPAFDESPEERASLARKLSYYLDADLSRNHVMWVVEAWRALTRRGDNDMQHVNFEINEALDTAGFRPPHILRYTEQETAA